MQIEYGTPKLDFSDVLIKCKRSELQSRKDVNLTRTFKFRNGMSSASIIPIMASNMDTVATINAAKVFEKHNLFTCLHKFLNLSDIFEAGLNPENFAVTIGMDDNSLNKLSAYTRNANQFKYVCVDVANGYTERFTHFIQKVKFVLKDKIIIAGNVCTPEMTEQLIISGADIVKIGIGPGNHCTTRKQTGVGYPQLSAIIECADAAHGLGGHIIGDGGCKVPGDIAKGFGGGADFMMVGSMFAAHDENSVFDEEGKTKVYGMSSTEAMNKHYGSVDEYRTSEGRISKLDNRGSLDTTILDILGSLRSTATYIGAKNIKDIPKCATFVLVNNQYSREYEKDTIGF